MSKRHHYYLNKIGISSKEDCVFNSSKKVNKKDKEKHAFDLRETYSLDYTLMTWLYEHIKVYLDIADKIVDLDSHKIEAYIITGWTEKDKPIREKVELTKRETCLLICQYIEKALKDENIFRTPEYEKAALSILAEIIPSLWW